MNCSTRLKDTQCQSDLSPSRPIHSSWCLHPMTGTSKVFCSSVSSFFRELYYSTCSFTYSIVYDAKHSNLVGTLSGHSGWVLSVCFGPDNHAVSCSSDKTVKVWNVGTRQVSQATPNRYRWSICLVHSHLPGPRRHGVGRQILFKWFQRCLGGRRLRDTCLRLSDLSLYHVLTVNLTALFPYQHFSMWSVLKFRDEESDSGGLAVMSAKSRAKSFTRSSLLCKNDCGFYGNASWEARAHLLINTVRFLFQIDYLCDNCVCAGITNRTRWMQVTFVSCFQFRGIVPFVGGSWTEILRRLLMKKFHPGLPSDLNI